MRDYETVIIWSASIPEGEIDKEHDRVVEIIKSNGGTYKGSDKWSRRILAYPIKKQTEGIYHFIKWNGSSNTTSAIDKHLRIHDNSLRFITLKNNTGETVLEDSEDTVVEEERESEDL